MLHHKTETGWDIYTCIVCIAYIMYVAFYSRRNYRICISRKSCGNCTKNIWFQYEQCASSVVPVFRLQFHEINWQIATKWVLAKTENHLKCTQYQISLSFSFSLEIAKQMSSLKCHINTKYAILWLWRKIFASLQYLWSEKNSQID